jgi:geranylgeranyl diphosphate synthase type II
MHSPKDLLNLIDSHISSIPLFQERSPARLYEPIRYIISLGGKRMRPLFTLMACNLFSEDVRPALPAALALEIFHNFSLLHDDIMDNAPLRRNQPTVHEKWDTNLAILSGDAMSIGAYALLSQLPGDFLPEILGIFNQTALEVCEGQQYDMEFETRKEVSLDDYLTMIHLKTAVLPAACLKIGAIIGGASPVDAQHLYEFGRFVGLAFQLQDDFLDVYGTKESFGKAIGGDILANKKTYLLVSALEQAKGEMAIQLQTSLLIQKPEEKISRITSLFDQLGLKQQTLQAQKEFFARGMACLDQVSVAESRKNLLKGYLSDLYERKS